MILRAIRVALVSLVAVPVAIAVAAPARAADTVSCSGAAFVFAADSGGALYRYGLNGPDRDPPSWSPREPVGSGWAGFGRVLAGQGGRLYGINAQGVLRYRYINGGWERTRRITDSWTAYATAQYRNKITVDETGDFYLVDAVGRLRWSRYNEQNSTWTVFNQVLDTGWNRFDLIVAGTAGTLYAREPGGKLFRFRYDTVSQRWLEQERAVGSGWNRFTKGIMSAGGDVLFGLNASGEMFHYRFREDDGSWPIGGKVAIGSGWNSFPNVTTMTDTCRLTANHTPARPSLPSTSSAPVAAVQAATDEEDTVGVLHFAYTNNGSLRNGSSFPGSPTIIQWTTDVDTNFTGKPTVLPDVTQGLQTVTQRRTSDVDLKLEQLSRTNLAGAMVASPVAVTLPGGAFAVFGVGADGSFWHRRQDPGTATLLPWTRLAGPALTGALTATPLTDGVVGLLAVDANGAIQAARYRDGVLESPWASMGTGEFVGAPATVTLPGPGLQVFARTADGDVATQEISWNGQFPGQWQPIANETLRGTGSPAALLVEQTGRIIVFSRSEDTVFFAQETTVGSKVWGDAQAGSAVGAVRSDPTALVFQDGDVWRSSYVARNSVGGVSLWTMSTGSAAKSGKAKPATFVEQVLPTKK